MLGALGGLVVWETVAQAKETRERREKYAAALDYARLVGKPLLVAGGPWGPWARFVGVPAGHGFGDVCIDINSAACRNGAAVEVADVRRIPYPSKHFGAVLASHVLEHLSSIGDAKAAIRELHRVADRVFIASPRKTSLMAQFHPGHHLWVSEMANGDILLEQRG